MMRSKLAKLALEAKKLKTAPLKPQEESGIKTMNMGSRVSSTHYRILESPGCRRVVLTGPTGRLDQRAAESLIWKVRFVSDDCAHVIGLTSRICFFNYTAAGLGDKLFNSGMRVELSPPPVPADCSSLLSLYIEGRPSCSRVDPGKPSVRVGCAERVSHGTLRNPAQPFAGIVSSLTCWQRSASPQFPGSRVTLWEEGSDWASPGIGSQPRSRHSVCRGLPRGGSWTVAYPTSSHGPRRDRGAEIKPSHATWP